MANQRLFDSWDVGGLPGRIECAGTIWDEITTFAMGGFRSSKSGGPEIGGLLFGYRKAGRVRIRAWREVPCEHARGPRFELSAKDETGLRELLANQDNNGTRSLEVVGWFQSMYWDLRWTHSTVWDVSLTSADVDLHKRYFAEPWQVALIIQRAKSGPVRAGFFFRKTDGTLDSVAREFGAGAMETPASSEPDAPNVSAFAAETPAETESRRNVMELSSVAKQASMGETAVQSETQITVEPGLGSEAVQTPIEPSPSIIQPTTPRAMQTPASSKPDAPNVSAFAAGTPAETESWRNVTELSIRETAVQCETQTTLEPGLGPELIQTSIEPSPSIVQPTTSPEAGQPPLAPVIKIVQEPLSGVLPRVALEPEPLPIPKAPVRPEEYWACFGLRYNPFAPTSGPEMIYWSRQHKHLLTKLLYCVENRRGIAVLTGEAGTGKTMLMASLGDCLNKGRIEFGFILNSRLTVEQLYQILAYDLALNATDRSNRAAVLAALGSLAIEQTHRGRTTALLIDEAHNLSADVVEEIRLLDNLHLNKTKLLQIVLAGQPRLDSRLEAPDFRSFKQRIALRCALDPFSEQDTCECVAQRFTKAGLEQQDVFPPDLLREIHRYSQGIPRTINTVCDNLLRVCAAAERKTATLELLDEVSKQLQP